MILQLAFVLVAIVIGARLGGDWPWRYGRYRFGDIDIRFWLTTHLSAD